MIRAPQPETVRDYRILVTRPDGQTVEVANVTGNHQRLRHHEFDVVEGTAVRVAISATNGSDTARLYEVRCYA